MPPTQAEPVELDLLREWREPLSSRRLLRDALGSLAVHAVAVTALLLAPSVEPSREAPLITSDLKRQSVRLVAPPRFFEPTQTAPNQGKVTRELDASSAVEGRQPQARRYRPPSPPPGPQRFAAPLVIESLQTEPPRIEAGAVASPNLGTAAPGAPLAAPRPSLDSRPEIPQPRTNPDPNGKGGQPRQPAAEKPPEAKPQPGLVVPPAPAGAGMTVGDIGADQPSIQGLNSAAPQCQTCSTLQLLSDPQNVDFKPYLLQLLAAVKRNWMTVIPEAARTGRRGVVQIRFVIDRNGVISNLVISSPSGTGAFDRAAVVGMSMSNPFPPLPPGYKGDQIRLQMAFAYNTAR